MLADVSESLIFGIARAIKYVVKKLNHFIGKNKLNEIIILETIEMSHFKER